VTLVTYNHFQNFGTPSISLERL